MILVWVLLLIARSDDICQPQHTRSDCGYFGIGQQECEGNGCCWDTSEPNVPYCFYKSPPTAGCDPTGQRVECGYLGINAQDCESQNCCWAPAGEGSSLPWCFSKNNSPASKPTLAPTHPQGQAPYDQSEMNKIGQFFFDNVDYGGQSGAVIASPSKENPDYFYHWQRDAAISMNVVFMLGGPEGTNDAHLEHYAQWIAHVQTQPDPNNINILGEPKFYLSGSSYDKPWGRPQNDGPALRSLVLSRFALKKLNGTQTERDYAQQTLWPLIKTDLAYVAQAWTQDSFDLWEEVSCQHFFTRLVQRCGLVVGAQVAQVLGDSDSVGQWSDQAQQIANALAQHWNEQWQVLEYAINPPPVHGIDKYHNLDVAILLGAMYGDAGDGVYDVFEPKVMKTVEALIAVFTDGSYPIQDIDTNAGLGGYFIGRYPNDTYTGTSTAGEGNPWVLATNALGEYYYRHALAVKIRKVTREQHAHYRVLLGKRYSRDLLSLSEALKQQGDDQLTRVRNHAVGDGFHLSEQLNRYTGMQQGANDLTWSYGTLLSAMEWRGKLDISHVKRSKVLF